MRSRTVLVVAKAPEPGRVKTRLCPPLAPAGAARLAEAALADTLDAVAACDADRRVLVLDGEPGDWLPPGFVVIPQRGDGLAERLANAWADPAGPAGSSTLQIGMDTPQITAALLDGAFASLEAPGVDAALGVADDGGWWAIGMRRPDPTVFHGIPMSLPSTGAAQARALTGRGLWVAMLPELRDVDTAGDVPIVGAMAPGSRFVATAGALGLLPAPDLTRS